MIRPLIGALALLIFAGCSSMKVGSHYDHNYDFQPYKTWNWRNDLPVPSDDPRLNQPAVIDRVKVAMNREMTAHGYTYSTESPDLLVQVQGDLEDNAYHRPNWGYEGYQEVDQWADGSITVLIREGKQGDLIWQGTAEAKVTLEMTPEERLSLLDKAVNKILSKFPPKPMSAF